MSEKYFFEEDGKLVEMTSDIVCTFTTDDNTKYIAYTDNQKDDKGNLIVYGAIIGDKNILKTLPDDELYLIQDSIDLLRKQRGDNNG